MRGMNRSQPCTTPIRLTASCRSQSSGAVSRNPATHPDAGVVDQQIHRVEPGVHCVGEFTHRFGVGDVDRLREHLGPKLTGGLGGLLQARFVQVADGQSRAAARGQQCRRMAHAAAGAGDQHDAVAQVLDVHG